MRSPSVALVGFALVLFSAACAGSTPEEDVGTAEGASSLRDANFVARPAPAGLPKPWQQPESRGVAGAQGMCGPTAIANQLLLHGFHYSPEAVYDTGGISPVGTTPAAMAGYFAEVFPDLDCDAENPNDGIDYLRTQLGVRRPVNVLLEMKGLEAHWVVVVGMSSGMSPTITVMSWGKYYDLAWSVFEDAWSRGWGGHHPAITCAAVTKHRFAH